MNIDGLFWEKHCERTMYLMKLMIVDDSNVIRRKIERSAHIGKLEVVGMAPDGMSAVKLCQQTDPDLVTMDLTMPHMDGIQCIEQLVAIKPSLLILVVSALADKATAIEALKKGAHGFLCKPFTEEELSDALDELLRGSIQ
jgi:two-component system, chemotaxis family, chemotaxis protein CheY